ncbi:hypothetical protein Afil01_48950 [Actinorhabdospora filicis]|uniref:Uncharacterized protein n=1 Tax=Actinorhabdospora filicis TaxID=1785913 RepID=A0A9W6SPQ0_9ACTN|nr:hypothetical protein [Actinorhabdospora filicis]GLZ80088.1 hypothetical protein Afil01_48950 [Actinorhabdospora filicis]
MPGVGKSGVIEGLAHAIARRAVPTSLRASRVMPLDCRFSGRAIDTLTGDGILTGQLDITGTYILTATAATQLALASAGERYTAFTGALLGVLREGIADGGSLTSRSPGTVRWGRGRRTRRESRADARTRRRAGR